MKPRWYLAGLCALGLLGCEVEVVTSSESEGSASPQAGAAAPGVKQAGATTVDAGLPPVEFDESDFRETEHSRDPFRSYAGWFAEEAKNRARGSQREVVLERYALDELKLVGIVTRIRPNRAMLVDPAGKGHIIRRGQLVGKAEVVRAGGDTSEYQVNWRVDRIRDEDVVFVREDPAHPDVPSATRVLPLRPEGSIIELQE